MRNFRISKLYLAVALLFFIAGCHRAGNSPIVGSWQRDGQSTVSTVFSANGTITQTTSYGDITTSIVGGKELPTHHYYHWLDDTHIQIEEQVEGLPSKSWSAEVKIDGIHMTLKKEGSDTPVAYTRNEP